ncbi:carbohydrate esterase family 5 protein [Aaosphaeria arxii CBS 175.79]|uniref:Cutinase n=1 Tax=Aaosphaeria arxii CBS 175.79 TaxID=1450172 RepID=A0A6A5XWA9_9PLEO|nr:carbohydrate esterase family 5 protein [Aaosphaeria arxii CBS 175.79]KAF2017452.1 carbohydrate esterase family 5 protein [Aaosphaeria arxii CBS 175.79]
MYMNTLIAAAILGLATASPVEVRQTRTSSSEFSDGGCRDILFAWARGSTEVGNMGTVVGPPTSNGLKANFGADNVATEGIEYAAALAPNALPGGTDAKSKKLMQDTINAMASQCPDSTIVVGGYSQGAAVCHRAVEELDPAVQNRIAGVVLYGDTQKQQDNNQIPNFPADKVEIICQPGDAVCRGTLTILPAHLTYGARADEGVDFLTKQIQGAQAKIKARKEKRTVEEAAGIADALATKMAKKAVKIMA